MTYLANVVLQLSVRDIGEITKCKFVLDLASDVTRKKKGCKT
jgi:hypothetical protein